MYPLDSLKSHSSHHMHTRIDFKWHAFQKLNNSMETIIFHNNNKHFSSVENVDDILGQYEILN